MRFYAISDIHGHFKKFKEMLALLRFSYQDRLFILGDVLDRGPEPIELLLYIMEHPNVELLLGNHEDMFLRAFVEKDKEFRKLMLENGGKSTIDGFKKLSASQKEEVLEYLSTRPRVKVWQNYILVHSGFVPERINLSKTDNEEEERKELEEQLSQQSNNKLLWQREEFFKFRALRGYTTVFGHTVTKAITGDKKKGPISIWHDGKFGDKIGIDCGVYLPQHGGRLGCLCLDNLVELYV